MILYFAYGSNLNEDQMRHRCPDSRIVSVAVLKNYQLAFNIFSPKRQCGCADVIKKTGSEVWGLIYELSDKDLEKLDRFERHPTHYKRRTLFVEDELGIEKEVQIYEVVDKSVIHKPSKDYMRLILDGAQKHNFPQSYQDFLNFFEVIN